jgi:hypothetical protein
MGNSGDASVEDAERAAVAELGKILGEPVSEFYNKG